MHTCMQHGDLGPKALWTTPVAPFGVRIWHVWTNFRPCRVFVTPSPAHSRSAVKLAAYQSVVGSVRGWPCRWAPSCKRSNVGVWLRRGRHDVSRREVHVLPCGSEHSMRVKSGLARRMANTTPETEDFAAPKELNNFFPFE